MHQDGGLHLRLTCLTRPTAHFWVSMHTRAMRRLLSVIAQMICFCVVAAQAQPYPSRPITIVVALPAGGAVDALARIIAEPMRSMLGQPVVIENLGGAGGTL